MMLASGFQTGNQIVSFQRHRNCFQCVQCEQGKRNSVIIRDVGNDTSGHYNVAKYETCICLRNNRVPDHGRMAKQRGINTKHCKARAEDPFVLNMKPQNSISEIYLGFEKLCHRPCTPHMPCITPGEMNNEETCSIDGGAG